MQKPLTLILTGGYWDAQLYMGLLYLFDLNGDVRIVDWDALVEALGDRPELSFALSSSLRDSTSAYRLLLSDSAIAHDTELTDLLKQRFASLAARSLEVDTTMLTRLTVGRYANPFPFPHADSDIHYGSLAVGADDGLFVAHLKTRRGTTKRHWHDEDAARKVWDGEVRGLAAKYRTIAVAAGGDGVWQVDLPINDDSIGEPVVYENGSYINSCSWVYSNIYASARDGAGGLLRFVWREDDSHPKGRPRREFSRFIPGHELIHQDSFSWGGRDRLVTASRDSVRSLLFRYRGDDGERAIDIGELHFAPSFGDVVEGATSTFGTVVELDEGVVVVQSDGVIQTLPRAPVRWRAYPRSHFYDNQLHVLYEDHMQVLAFSHDYFLDQRSKKWGAALDARRLRDQGQRRS